ncbi:MAG TPA: hypothetical protein VIV11_26470 [Kofleriaceae bacterium]
MRGLIDMRLPCLRRQLLRALPVLAILTAPASADTLAVTVAPELALPDETVRAAIAAELGNADGNADLGSVEVALADPTHLVVTHRRPDGSVLARTVELPALPADRLAMIAYVTGNLVRDQLADLAPATPMLAPATAPVVPVAPTAFVAPAPGFATTATAVPPSAETPEVTVPVSIGFVPPLSTDRLFTNKARVRAALNVIIGSSASVDGFSISGVADLSANVRGLQIGGAASIAEDVRGGQLAGAVAVARDLHGIQLAGSFARADDMEGIQAAGAAVVCTHVRGAQLAGAAAFARYIHGIQAAGAATVTRGTRGIQASGGAAISKWIDGIQMAPIAVAESVHGLQLGVINVAGNVRGLQLGVINVGDYDDRVQLGVLNFVRNGRNDVDAWVETNGLAALALRHGGRHMHNIYAVGFARDGGDTPMLGLGLGYHRPLGGAMLDLDGMAWQTHMFKEGVGLLSQARATIAIDIGPVAAFVAAAYNVSVEDHAEMRPLNTALARTVGDPMTGVDVALWPSFAVGVRGRLGAR